MKTLYFDCFSGISGDMSIAALIDLGIDAEWFIHQIKSLSFLPEHIALNFDFDVKKGVKARTFRLIEHKQEHHHRSFSDIKQFIETENLKPEIKNTAINIFQHVASAESKIHNTTVDQVHFHEVGALDSIIDIIGVSILIEEIKPEKIVSSPVTLGSGMIQCQHGTYPVPAMATLEILKSIPVIGGIEIGELTTPTGAAIISELADDFSTALPKMTVQKIGYGAGTKNLKKQPNVLRVILGETD